MEYNFIPIEGDHFIIIIILSLFSTLFYTYDFIFNHLAEVENLAKNREVDYYDNARIKT